MMAPKIILTRPLPAEKGLEGGAILDQAERDGLVTVVRWTRDEPVDRTWLIDELKKGDVQGLLCMHNGEKVRLSRSPLAHYSGGEGVISPSRCADRSPD
jgi:hypothetical protein